MLDFTGCDELNTNDKFNYLHFLLQVNFLSPELLAYFQVLYHIEVSLRR
jgi:hypothetical protein